MTAQNEARAAGNTEIRTEHLVLGLLSESEGLAGLALNAQHVTADAVRTAVTALLPPAQDEVPDLVPFDASAKKALELTFREALRLGHDFVGTEHLLLALLELENGDGVLSGLGVDKAGVEATVTEAWQSSSATRTGRSRVGRLRQLVAPDVRAEEGLQRGHGRDRDERPDRAQQGGARHDRPEGHGRMDVDGLRGQLRLQDVVLELLVQHDEPQDVQRVPGVDGEGDQDRQRAREVGADGGDELRDQPHPHGERGAYGTPRTASRM